MRKHNELSQVIVTVTPLDLNSDPYTPTSARYKINDKISGSELVEWTSLTPSTSMQIIIAPSVNAIITDNNDTEIKVVTVQLDDGLSTQHYIEYEYKVINLQFVQ